LIDGSCSLTAAGAGTLLDRAFDHFAGFTGEFLNPAQQFLLLAFGVTKVIIRELGLLLLQLAFGNVPVAFNFKFVHISMLFVLVVRPCDGKVL